MTNKNDLTVEEAIIELNRCKINGYAPTDWDRRCKAVELAKMALEKQIAQKPDLKPRPLKNEVFWWQCPKCNAHNHTNTMHRFCHHCGQAIDWAAIFPDY